MAKAYGRPWRDEIGAPNPTGEIQQLSGAMVVDEVVDVGSVSQIKILLRVGSSKGLPERRENGGTTYPYCTYLSIKGCEYLIFPHMVQQLPLIMSSLLNSSQKNVDTLERLYLLGSVEIDISL